MTDFNKLPGQENYWAGYEESINKLKNDPNLIEFDKLCFLVFGISENGKQLLEYFKDRIIFPSIPGQADNNFDKRCMYYEGYKEAFRQLIHATNNYKIRKEAEEQKIISKQAQEAKE